MLFRKCVCLSLMFSFIHSTADLLIFDADMEKIKI